MNCHNPLDICLREVYKQVDIKNSSMITHKFRLYPNKQVEEKMLWTLEKCRQTYNVLLSELQQQEIMTKHKYRGYCLI